MTRVSASPQMPPKPTSVALSEMAIAAGIAGYSVAMCFQDFPAPLLCQLWQNCIRYAGPVKVRHVRTQADVRKLAGCVSEVRLALVSTARLRASTSWAIQMATTMGDERNTRPALFCCGDAGEAEDDPGATLVLRGDPAEHAALGRWLLFPDGELPDWDVVPPDPGIQIDPCVDSALSSWYDGACFRDRQVLQALLRGASLARGLQQVGMVIGTQPAGAEDYELVRRLLQTRLAAGADEAHDPLAADMVARANVYMAIKYSAGSDNPFGGDNGAVDRGERPPRELVTRREVANLGNVRSQMVRRLIEYLRRQPNGYGRFRRMGLVRRPPEPEAWQRPGVDELLGYLRPWSAKQVRTHFDQLRRAGMITAEREHGNAPWRYALPEELKARANAFRGLPAIEGRPEAPAP